MHCESKEIASSKEAGLKKAQWRVLGWPVDAKDTGSFVFGCPKFYGQRVSSLPLPLFSAPEY